MADYLIVKSGDCLDVTKLTKRRRMVLISRPAGDYIAIVSADSANEAITVLQAEVGPTIAPNPNPNPTLLRMAHRFGGAQ